MSWSFRVPSRTMVTSAWIISDQDMASMPVSVPSATRTRFLARLRLWRWKRAYSSAKEFCTRSTKSCFALCGELGAYCTEMRG